MKQTLLLLLTTLLTTHAFQTIGTVRTTNGPLFSAVTNDQQETTEASAAVSKDNLLKRDRYVATNRFTVRPGRAAKFEKRWGEFNTWKYLIHNVISIDCAHFWIYSAVGEKAMQPCNYRYIYIKATEWRPNRSVYIGCMYLLDFTTVYYQFLSPSHACCSSSFYTQLTHFQSS